MSRHNVTLPPPPYERFIPLVHGVCSSETGGEHILSAALSVYDVYMYKIKTFQTKHKYCIKSEMYASKIYISVVM